MNRISKFVPAVFLIAVLVFFMMISVPEGYVGVVITRGAAKSDVLRPGRHLTNPFTTKVVLMDMRWKKYSTVTSAFSKDIQQVDITVSMSYQIKCDGALGLYRSVGEDYADKIMLPCLLDAVKSTFAKYSAEELISKREEISDAVRDALERELEFYKLAVREVVIEDIDFTDAFTDAIEEKQVATQKKLQVETEQEQQTLVAKAEAERVRIKAEADAEEQLIRAQAEADAVRIAAEAEAEANKKIASSLTPELIEKIKYERWDGQMPMVSGNSTPIVAINPTAE